MPRRLGDDPLARARNKSPQGPGLVAEAGSPQLTVKSSRSSFNDVFFQRRSEAIVAAPTALEPESPEISEISQIPEIHEAVAAEVTAAPATPEEPPPEAPPVQALPAPPDAAAARSQASFIAEVVARFNESAPTASPTAAEPLVGTTAVPSRPDVDIEGPLPQSGSFFKRLFGKLK